ncbi:hypothetical protein JAAARDRAFT_418899 [Jaapia argillacea MUCL 33604]|uniref:Uncharacterized protein n=1 Tax=Jaapia argillacea MUCL 33604 TaxID=933084 RepID=A0A067PJF7_9AGAM|nr:hypothetical protein JAAARDRAFT_418899 [Jaapia argillacea MUCL 33604]
MQSIELRSSSALCLGKLEQVRQGYGLIKTLPKVIGRGENAATTWYLGTVICCGVRHSRHWRVYAHSAAARPVDVGHRQRHFCRRTRWKPGFFSIITYSRLLLTCIPSSSLGLKVHKDIPCASRLCYQVPEVHDGKGVSQSFACSRDHAPHTRAYLSAWSSTMILAG